MFDSALFGRRPTRPRQVLSQIPAPRRFTVALGLAASLGVAVTSVAAAPLALLVPLMVIWLSAFAAGALWARGGPVLLTVLAALVKLITVGLIVWAVTHPHSAIGPHGPADWVPLGALNAATGIWLLRVIRHQAA